jgi:hypothetical protein
MFPEHPAPIGSSVDEGVHRRTLAVFARECGPTRGCGGVPQSRRPPPFWRGHFHRRRWSRYPVNVAAAVTGAAAAGPGGAAAVVGGAAVVAGGA